MNISPEIRMWIDRYLNGQLSGSDLQDFMQRLESDNSFQQEVSFQNLLVEGIRQAADQELIDRVVTDIGYRKPRFPLGLKLIVTFVILTTGGIILWNYAGPDRATPFADKLAFAFLKKQKDLGQSEKKNATKQKAEHATSEEISKSNVKIADETQAEESDVVSNPQVKTESDSSAANSEITSPEFVVKKDQLLISAIIPVVEKGTTDKSGKTENANGSLSQSTTDKLNPEAGLVDNDSKPADKMETEFWVSPVNYQGYKMAKNKLVLYGIEEPDAVKLFRYNETLYMRYGNDIYKLVPVEEYASYHKIKETEIPLVLR